MIRSALPALLVLGALALAAPVDDARADDAAAGDASGPDAAEGSDGSDEREDPLSPYRADFNVLADRTIGTASRPVVFNWRRTHVHLAATGSYLLELNTFNSARAGGLVRLPTGRVLVELGASYVAVGETQASRQLALTPYRQAGRPSRVEIDAGVSLPLAEGIVTARTKWFPATQLVFSGYAGLRYSLYPTGWRTMTFRQVMQNVVSPRLSNLEVDNLDTARKDAMEVDRGRYGVVVGLGNDIYFKQGLFLAPRLTVAVPLLAPASDTKLLFWADLSLAVGVAL